MNKRIHPMFPTWLLALGLLLVFVAEHVILESGPTRVGILVGGIGCAAAAALVRLLGWFSANADEKRVRARLLVSTVFPGVGLGLYFLATTVFAGTDSFDVRMREVLWAVWPIALLIGFLPLVFLESHVAPVAYIGRYENMRLNHAFQRGLSLALLLSTLFFFNFLANRHDTKWELSAGHRAVASEVTKDRIKDLTQEVTVTLYYPRTSEVADSVARYLSPLQEANANLRVQRLDHALATEEAKEMKVTSNGYIVVSHDKLHEKVRISDKPASARAQLRRLDQNFLKALIRTTTEKKVAYFSAGHDERSSKTRQEEDQSEKVTDIRQLLKDNQFEVRDLSLRDGFADDIPEDAGMLFVLGPRKPLLEEELASMHRWMNKGGRILLALDSRQDEDTAASTGAFLRTYGLSYDGTPLANVGANARITGTKADRYHIWSNRYSSHESVTTLTRNERLVTIFERSGSLSMAKEKPAKVKGQIVVHAMPNTFQDKDGDMEFNADVDSKSNFGLAAAVTKAGTTAKKENEGRLFVLADTGIMSDKLWKVQGNPYLLVDIVHWLQKSTDPVVPTIAEKDIKIQHRRDEDWKVFYGTTFLVPGLILLAGFLVRRRRVKA